MPLALITGPTLEPISLIEAKTHLRQTAVTADDTLIKSLIAAARAYAETKCQRQIIAARWKLILDSFPGPSLMVVEFGGTFSLPAHAILIPRVPVLQVVSVQYTAMDGTLTTMPAADYAVDLATEPARITPVFGKIWPIPLPQIGAVQVTFDAGHAAPLTANIAADTITVPAWKTQAVNDAVRVVNRDVTAVGDGALPQPLAINTDYFVQSVVSAGVYKLAATSGGAAIDITNAGTGDNFIGELPHGLKAWMLLAIGTLYENREAVMVDTRITTAELPLEFIDGLLDPYRMVLY